MPKKLFGILLVLTLLVGFCPTIAIAQTDAANGNSRSWDNVALIWWIMYRYRLQKFEHLYNESVSLGVDNETLQEALHYKEIAEEHYNEAIRLGRPIRGTFVPQQIRLLRLAYLNIKKAVKILEKALNSS